MWLDDTIRMLAAWLGLRHGMNAIDVGCGLGYLGYTYWEYFGKGGQYVGVDDDAALIRDAKATSRDWATGGQATFLAGSAYRLPFADGCSDWVMCQGLLMHLEKPEEALSEMARVVKPGGLVMCNEPDNINPKLGRLHSSAPEPTIEEHLLCAKVYMHCHRGRIRLGRGDEGIGPKIPRMMKRLGLTDISVRLNDRVHYLEPPYDDPLQKDALEKLRKAYEQERYETLKAREKQEFLAGDGNLEEYGRYRHLVDRFMATYRKQIEAGEYYACAAGAIYTIKARRPGPG